MSYTFKDNTDEVLSALEKAIEKGLTEIGIEAEKNAVYKITSYPAVDTGRLRNSITHAVKADEKAVYIGTNVEYGSFVELGTSKMPPRPFLKPAATEHNDEYQKITGGILHWTGKKIREEKPRRFILKHTG